ncbi:pyridoxamine 5'-phosphate oxidase [Marinomonas agarivorans]|nr:pyridoxamine 5'-phosphate oxidase [Marinomonas agarivorans]
MNQDISALRRDYQFQDLLESEIPQDPFTLFDHWLEQAIESCPYDPTAMTLSTVDPQHAPHSRIVLLKQRQESGFVFFTNYDSDKGKEIATNNKACLNFFWPELSRQVRIEGTLHKVERTASETYFASRPKDSQIAATASPQSKTIDRETLHSQMASLTQTLAEQDVPCPKNWGGYELKANYLEFWQGRPSRLHDRLCFQLQADTNWHLFRRAP